MKSCFVKGPNGRLWWEWRAMVLTMFVVGPNLFPRSLPVFTTLSITERSFEALIMVRQGYFCNWSRFLPVILCFNQSLSLNSCYDNFLNCLFLFKARWNTNGLAWRLISFQEFLCFSTQVIYPATVNYVSVPRGFVTVGSIFVCSDRSSWSGNFCPSVASVPYCLKLWIFISLTSLHKESVLSFIGLKV